MLVVGAGLAGAIAARTVADAGLTVLALDKGRGPGGRLSTRRTASGAFDHGAALLQAHGAAFRAWLDAHVEAGRAAHWRGGWVGVPGMNALVAGTLEGIEVKWSMTVAALSRQGGRWQAVDAEGRLLAEAPMLVLAVPAPQARAMLLAGASGPTKDPLIAALGEARYLPCWVALIVVDEVLCADRGECASSVILAEGESVLAAAFREADKPGRKDVGHWVVHATADWSEANLECGVEPVAAMLREAFVRAVGIDAAAIRSVGVHRWRYARPARAVALRVDAIDGLVFAGDAFGEPSAEALPPAERAWHSGRIAAAQLLSAVAIQPKS